MVAASRDAVDKQVAAAVRANAGQDYEVRYEAKKTGKSKGEVKRAIKRAGPSRRNERW